MHFTTAVAATVLLAVIAQPAAAQRVGIHAEGGVAHTHGASAAGVGFHVFTFIDRQGSTRLDFGVIGDAYSFALDAGLDYRVPVATRWTVVIRGGGGLMVEGPEWAGPFLRAGGGVAWTYSPNQFVTVIFDGGTHDGFAGPNRVMLGWERRFGRKR
jgi:hypothetical protein